MEQEQLNQVAVNAYLELIALNMQLWRPEVADWLHSEAAEQPLLQLLALVPCPSTIH
jgi:hypothetical protein